MFGTAKIARKAITSGGTMAKSDLGKSLLWNSFGIWCLEDSRSTKKENRWTLSWITRTSFKKQTECNYWLNQTNALMKRLYAQK